MYNLNTIKDLHDFDIKSPISWNSLRGKRNNYRVFGSSICLFGLFLHLLKAQTLSMTKISHCRHNYKSCKSLFVQGESPWGIFKHETVAEFLTIWRVQPHTYLPNKSQKQDPPCPPISCHGPQTNITISIANGKRHKV